MKLWFDTEFIEDGKTIDLISIGIVREDGETLYLENKDCDLSRASPWVQENVIVHLQRPTVIVPRWRIAQCVQEFAGPKPEFWGYYADYDWVVLCQLYGTMMDLPKGWPMYCRDVKQLADSMGNPPLPPQEGDAHHALADAKWTKLAWDHLQGLVVNTATDTRPRMVVGMS